jgi:hypothetical protein
VQHAVEGRGPSVDVLHGIDLLCRGREGLDPHVCARPGRYAAVAGSPRGVGTPAAADGLGCAARSLDREYRRASPTAERRQIVTSHAAFGYLAARYGLQQCRLVGLQPEAEPGPRTRGWSTTCARPALRDRLRRDALASPALADTVAREAGVATAVDPLKASRPPRSKQAPTTSPSCARTCGAAEGAGTIAASAPAVDLEAVSFAYRGGPRVLEGRPLTVERGSFLGIAGPNGGGKTTLRPCWA